MTDQIDNEEKIFQLGLTMSGAISAGAYTAGVFDFLIQALDEWEKARNGEDKESVPSHRVGIKVMSGASAGAITAAIGTIALADGNQRPYEFSNPAASTQRIEYYLPRLYEAWVVKPTLVAHETGALDFLSTSDVSGLPKPKDDFSHTSGCEEKTPEAPATPPPVVSLLNARLLDKIAQDSLAAVQSFSPSRSYIAETLHIYMTLSNLRGVPYTVKFEGGDYQMTSHGDRVHYAVGGLGSWDSPSAFGASDQKREIDASSLSTECPKWRDFSIFALASAAFPIGLAPRNLSATLGSNIGPDGYAAEYKGRLFPIDSLAGRTDLISPSFSEASDEPFVFRTADGGIIDNDPFEYARFCLKTAEELKSGIEDPAKRLPENVDHAVIMISPFPASGPNAPKDQPAPDILSIFSALLPSLLDQVRFKPSELVLAADENFGSRYLIGPTRTLFDNSGNEKQARYTIASGLLGGFGGFVAQSFRDHDFQLGRRNCQWFLKTNFALPAEKSIIAHGFRGISKESFKALDTDTHKAKGELVIIPLFGTASDEVTLPQWPRINEGEFETLQKRIATRFDSIAPKILAANVRDWLLGFLLQIALCAPFGKSFGPLGIIRKKALDTIRLTILADLVRRDQIKGWDFGESPEDLNPDDIRLVLAELLNPGYDFRNIAGLAKATGLKRPTVIEIIAFLEKAGAKGGKPFEIWTSPIKDNEKGNLYTLASRKPGPLSTGLSTIFRGTKLGFFLTRPRVDAPGI